MARAKKDLNSLTKTVNEGKKQTKVDVNITCFECGETKSSSEFYQSYGTSGLNVTHICKDCVVKGCLDENGEYDLVLFQRMLQKLDKPFLNQIYITTVTKCSGDVESIVGNYMKNIHMKQYRGLTFTNSDMGKVEELVSSVIDLDEVLDSKEKERLAREKIDKASKNGKLSAKRREELIDKFGRFDDDTLNRFETRYQKMAKGYQIHTALHQEALITYCKFSVLQDIAIESNNTTEAKMYGDLATKARMDAKLNPNQINLKDMQVGGVDSFAQISELVAKRDGLINIPMIYLKKPQDILDYQLMENVNYMRASFNMPELTYEDINRTYLDRIEKFNERYDADIMNNDFGTWGD